MVLFSTNTKNIGTLYFNFTLFTIPLVGIIFFIFKQFISYESPADVIYLTLFSTFVAPPVGEFSFLFSAFVPIMIYHNADSDKSRILSENFGFAGIYMWTHNHSGKIYIGSAVNLSKRFSQYYFSSYLRYSDNYISRALIEYTHSAFSLAILEYVEITNLSLEEVRLLILKREQYYLDLIFEVDFGAPNTYNLNPTAGSRLGSNHTEETKVKISKSLSGENHPMYGKEHSAETKIKMSETSKGKQFSAETKSKLSIVKGTQIFVHDISGTLINNFPSARKAALFFKVDKDTIMRHVKNNIIFKNEYILSTPSITKDN